MKPQTFGLVSDSAIADFVNFINPIWRKLAAEKTPIIVKISTKNEDYSSAQRRLYMAWCTEFANHFGEEQKRVHHDMKRRYLINIYRRDDEGFAAMCDAIAALKDNDPEQHKAIGDGVIKLTSITKASKIQMSEYMDLFYKFAQKHGLTMKTPDDLMWLSDKK